ncbi:MAG TPA: AAA family ATPase [Dehalococcoidia bacterium]|nr:AAA family ATPase [Dehalococcoidia bacterium]
MIIEKLKVKNYKSLEDVEIPLRPLTVFVGPNNSGKSNVFDCLEFVRDLALMGSQAVGIRGGFQYLIWGGDLRRAIEIELQGTVEDGEGRNRRFRYEVGAAGVLGSPAAYLLTREKFALYEDAVEWKLLERSDSRTIAWNEQDPSQQLLSWSGGEPRLGISSFKGSPDPRNHTLASFAAAVGDWGFYRLVPTQMGSPGPARREAYLAESGENLASVLISIQSEGRKVFGELEAYLNAAVPEIEEFLMGFTEDSRAFFRWRERGLPADFNVPSWNSSDGTRQILALLALRFASKTRPLLCVEEPENFIHPGLMELVADLLKSMSSKTQVLLTTHSPYLLNQLLPEDLLIVEKKGGRTQVRGLKEKKIREALKVLGLGELWYAGDIGGVP